MKFNLDSPATLWSTASLQGCQRAKTTDTLIAFCPLVTEQASLVLQRCLCLQVQWSTHLHSPYHELIKSLQITTDYTEQSIQQIMSAPHHAPPEKRHAAWSCTPPPTYPTPPAQKSTCTFHSRFKEKKKGERGSISNRGEEHRVPSAPNIRPLNPVTD